jgi:hypothetical protein
MALFSLRTFVVAQSFERGAAFANDLQTAVANLPRGVKIAAITFTTAMRHRVEPEWFHSICLAVIENSALVPSLFHAPEQQPLLLAPEYRALTYPPAHLTVSASERTIDQSILANVDYLVAINEDVVRAGYLSHLLPVFRSKNLTLYRVPHP